MIQLWRRQEGLVLVIPASAVRWVALGGLLLVATLFRLTGMDKRPLQPQEVGQAFESLSLYRGSFEGYASAPLVTNVQALLFLLFGDGDLVARLPGLLAGLGLICLPLVAIGLDQGGRIGAALVAAISSVSLYASREGAAAAPTALLAGLAVIAAWNFIVESRRRWIILGSLALGLGLGIDPAFVTSTGVLLVILFAGSAWDRQRELVRWLDPPTSRLAFLTLTASFVLGATLLGTSPPGFQAALSNLWRWPADLRLGEPWRLSGWLIDDPLLILSAVVGAWMLLRRRRRETAPLLIWAAIQVLLSLVCRAPDPRYLAQAVLPLSLLGGRAVDAGWRLVRQSLKEGTWWLALLALVPLIFLYVSALQKAANDQALPLAVALFGAAALGLICLYLASTRPLRQLATAGAALVALLLTLAQIRGIAVLNLGDVRAGQSLLRTSVTLENVHDVATAAIRWDRAAAGVRIVVDEQLRPSLSWELRDVQSVRYESPRPPLRGSAILEAGAPRALLVGRQATQIPIAESVDFSNQSNGAGTLLRWFAARDTFGGLKSHAILLVR